jgi:AAA domain/DnaB-like helicase N terminal domain
MARKPKGDASPSDHRAECAALGCVFDASARSSMAEVDAILDQLTPAMFYDGRNVSTLAAMKALRAERHAVDPVTVCSQLDKSGATWPGYESEVSGLVDSTLSVSFLLFPTYLEILQEYALRRWTLQKRQRLETLATTPGLTLDQIRDEFAEISDTASRIGKPRRKPVEVVKPSEILAEDLPDDLALVGDGDISRGYQGVTVLAGPPGSGKSLSADALAIAGFLGPSARWFDRPVRRQFKTLVIQSENGRRRLKKVFQAMRQNYPKAKIDEWIRYTVPPEGGLPFSRPEFRREIARIIGEFRPDVVVVDPWTALAVEDGSKDVIDTLTEIRSTFPPGDEAPALCIVAHTKKPRAEDKGNRGRALMYSVMGSQSLVSTARCVIVLLPFTDDIQDDRVLFAYSKLSDAELAPADTVWHRKLGGLFDKSDDDPKEFWSDDKRADGPWLTPEMLSMTLRNAKMSQTRLAEKLAAEHNNGKGVSSVHKWLKREQFASMLQTTPDGLLGLKD